MASFVICAFLCGAVQSKAVTVTVDPTQAWVGFMNVFDTGAPGYGLGGAGAFVFASAWGTADLKASFAAGPANPLTLSANTIGDPNPFWYTPSGGPGAVGNKIMDANMYVEQTGPLAGQAVTFTGIVLANSLLGPVDAAGHGWTSVAFIKDFAPDFSSFNTITAPLNALGAFSITLNTIADPARHVQYGFETIGPDVWAGDPLSLPIVQVTAIPEPSSIALVLTGLLGVLAVGWKKRRV